MMKSRSELAGILAGSQFSKKAAARIGRVLLRARLVLLWERLWPQLFFLVMVGLAYAALSWMGLWLAAPVFVKIAALAGFAAAFAVPLFRISRVRFPETGEGIARVEVVSGVAHRPLTASLDTPSGGHADDPASAQGMLWRAHQKRISDSLARLRAGGPRPQLAGRDPYALRALVVLVAFIGFNVAGADRLRRLGDLFDFSVVKAAAVARLDAWVTPPDYTGKPPIFLTGEKNGAGDGPVVVPEGSVITIRSVNSGGAALVTFDGEKSGIVVVAAKGTQERETASLSGKPLDPAPSGISQADFDLELRENGIVSITQIGESRNWAFAVVPDRPPAIAFAEKPETQRSGAIQVIAALDDDYGVIAADALIAPAHDEIKDGEEGNEEGASARPLYDAPDFPLNLSRGRMKDGVSKTLRALVDHPWAGADVVMTLRAVDEAGHEGASEPYAFRLPARRFVNPLARALVEQRRALAMDGNYAGSLVDVIDVLTVRPEQFEDDYATLIALAAIRRGLLDARDDGALRGVVDDLWDLAVGLEDGDLSDAERNLRDALEALREGIENGASEEELARLMEEARQAMDEFMQALAEQAARDGDTAENQAPPVDPSRLLNPQDLQKMLDRIDDLARTGSKDAAKQLLSELQQMMENLQASRQQQGQQGQSQAQQMLNELGEMIRRQQQLMDETFREQREGPGQQQGRQQGRSGGREPGGEQGRQQGRQKGQGEGQTQGQGQAEGQAQGQRGLEGGQNALADRLQRFLDRLGEGGTDPSGELGEAQRSMRGAADELGRGDLGGAGEQQSDALSQLRKGAQALAEQMAGEGEGEGDHNLAQGDRRTDPLGRREGRRGADFGDDVDVPDEIDTQRAREILDAIRKRLGETLRPEIELDYLERLLRSE